MVEGVTLGTYWEFTKRRKKSLQLDESGEEGCKLRYILGVHKKKNKEDDPHQHSVFVYDCLTDIGRVVRQPSVSFYHAKHAGAKVAAWKTRLRVQRSRHRKRGCGCKGRGIENVVATLASLFNRYHFNNVHYLFL